MANGFQGPPAADFYTQLSGLGDTIAANRAAQAKRDAFAQATTPGPDGQIDYGKAILGLAQVDPQAAALLAAQRNHADTLKQQGIDNARNTTNDTFSHGIQSQTLKLAQSKEGRAAADWNDETPDGFIANPDKTPGATAYIPKSGGPQDPAYLARVDAEKARAKGDVPTIIGAGSSVIVPNKAAEGPVFTNKISGGGLSADALDIRAAQWNNGDYEGATKNVGRGAQGGATLEAIANRAAERLVEKGHTPDQAAAMTSQNMQKFRASGIYQNTESRTGASREANLNIILKAADAAIPAALEASDKVSRTGFVPLNKVIQAGKVMTSDPDLRQFGMANLQLAEHWARAMNPTGVMRESDRDMALHFLSLADTKETYKSSVMQLKTQITRERDAIRASTPGHEPAAASGDTTGNRTASGVPWSIQ